MGFRFVVLGALLAMASAFSPTTPARSVVPSSRVSTPIVMAGWKDPYMDKFTGKKETLKTAKTDFDLEMERTAKLGGLDSVPLPFTVTTVAIVAYFVYLVVSA